jgi:hypothetical protein
MRIDEQAPQLADMQALQREFFRSYDPAKHSALADDILVDKFRRTEFFLGEGRHFRAWKVLMGPGRYQVLTLSNGFFESERGSAGVLRWLRDMKILQAANLPLVPPFAVLRMGEKISMMMPFGESRQPAVNAHWLPLDQSVKQLVANLEIYRLFLDDEFQIKVCDGVPFVCDFSDLRPLTEERHQQGLRGP